MNCWLARWTDASRHCGTTEMYYVVTIATLITMALALGRALLGPSIYDRVLAANMFGTKTVLLLSVIAFLYGRPDFLDLALAYALINFIGVLAVLEFIRRRPPEQVNGPDVKGGP